MQKKFSRLTESHDEPARSVARVDRNRRNDRCRHGVIARIVAGVAGH